MSFVASLNFYLLYDVIIPITCFLLCLPYNITPSATIASLRLTYSNPDFVASQWKKKPQSCQLAWNGNGLVSIRPDGGKESVMFVL